MKNKTLKIMLYMTVGLYWYVIYTYQIIKEIIKLIILTIISATNTKSKIQYIILSLVFSIASNIIFIHRINAFDESTSYLVNKHETNVLPIIKDIDISQMTIPKQIEHWANVERFGDADLLKRIAFCESSYNPNAININMNGTYDLGLFQFNSIHKNEAKPLDIEWSTKTAIDWINDGRLHAWNASKSCWNK